MEALLVRKKSLTEIATELGLSKPGLLRHLRALREIGVVEQEVVRSREGRETYYSLRAGSLHLELRPDASSIISWVSAGPVDNRFPLASQIEDEEFRKDVLAVLGGLHGGLMHLDAWDDFAIVLFGSGARGEATWKSDIDLLFVAYEGDARGAKETLGLTLSVIQEETRHRVQPHFTTIDALLDGRKTVDKEAIREGMILHAPSREVSIWRAMTRYKRIWL